MPAVYIYRDSASVESTRGGLAHARPNHQAVCGFVTVFALVFVWLTSEPNCILKKHNIIFLPFIVRSHLTSKRRSVLYFPYSALFSRVKGHKGSPVLPRLLAGIMRGSLLRRAYFKSLRVAEAKNAATINQLKYRSHSCIMENIALGAWSRENKTLGCASCFIGSRPRPRAIFPVMHSHSTLTSI